MIRLATVFSGIGAIEHALQRMQIKNEIIFACDNGDVSILTKKIDMNIDEIGNELKALSKIIKKIQFNDEVEDLYKNQLDGMLAEALNENQELSEPGVCTAVLWDFCGLLCSTNLMCNFRIWG